MSVLSNAAARRDRASDAETTIAELRKRHREQVAIATFSQAAIVTRDMTALLRQATALVASVLEVDPVIAAALVSHGVEQASSALLADAADIPALGEEDARFLQSIRQVLTLSTDERRRADGELAEYQQRFARIFRASPVPLGMSTMTEGRILDVNESWLALLGYTREEVIGRTGAELGMYLQSTRDAALAQMRRTDLLQNLEMQIRTKTGEVLDVVVSAVPFSADSGADAWLSALVNMTDHKRAEAERDELLEREQSARADAELALRKLDAIYSITDGVASPGALSELLSELLGRLKRILQLDFATVFLLDDERKALYLRAGHGPGPEPPYQIRVPLGRGVAGRVAAEGRPLIVNDYSTIDLSGMEEAVVLDLRGKTSAAMGAPFWIGDKVAGVVMASTSRPRQFTEPDLKLLTLVADRVGPAIERGRLIEKIRSGRERQRALSRRLLTAQEEERRRLAGELHDELGQVLTAVKINLESLERAPGVAPAPAALGGMIKSVDDALQRVRDIALDLRPSVLDDLGLAAALRWYTDRLARDAGVEAHLSIDTLPDVESGLETACFRVAQEALTNVSRHARAHHVWIDLRVISGALELTIRDDGIGFDVAAARERAIAGASLGLLGMQERVSLMGGEYEIVNVAAGGTEVRVRFPMEANP
jgi:PAS domain S-box-containing protein